MRRILLPLWLLAAAAHAQDPPPAVLREQRGGTFVEPPAQVDPVYLPTGPDAPAGGDAAGPPLTLQLSVEVPLRRGGTASLGRGVQGSTAASPSLQALVRWRPLAASPWFVQATFFRYLHGERQQPWHPDFTYAFGYEDWRPDSWSLVYANYTGTRFTPGADEGRFNFPQGQWTLTRRFALPQALQPYLLAGDGDSATCVGNLHFTPKYVEFTAGDVRAGKTALSLGCRYQRASGWFAHAALFAWPDGAQQQPWDPDFTYGFGYAADGPGPGTLELRYGNYSGNRFPGRARGAGEGSFRSGSVTLSWTTTW